MYDDNFPFFGYETSDFFQRCFNLFDYEFLLEDIGGIEAQERLSDTPGIIRSNLISNSFHTFC
jgi:hypothetical protein